jgi:hypothetical protein
MLCNIFNLEESNPTEKYCNFGLKCALKFLIVLPVDDFRQQSCWFLSKIDMLKHNSRKFPGKLEILNWNDLMNHHVLLNRQKCFIQNKLYVRLPKEKKYVEIEEFPSKYIESQLEELGDLLLQLHAENVKIRRILENPAFEIESPLKNIHKGVSNYVSKMGANAHSCLEIIYNLPKQKMNITKTTFFYYPLWETLIENRIDHEKCYDEYIYEYRKPCFVEEDFCAFLRSCEINVPMIDSEISSFKLHYEIFYYMPEMI